MKRVNQLESITKVTVVEKESPNFRAQLASSWGHPSPRVVDTLTNFPVRHILHNFSFIIKILFPLFDKSKEGYEYFSTRNPSRWISQARDMNERGQSLLLSITFRLLQLEALGVLLCEQHTFLPWEPYRTTNIYAYNTSYIKEILDENVTKKKSLMKTNSCLPVRR